MILDVYNKIFNIDITKYTISNEYLTKYKHSNIIVYSTPNEVLYYYNNKLFESYNKFFLHNNILYEINLNFKMLHYINSSLSYILYDKYDYYTKTKSYNYDTFEKLYYYHNNIIKCISITRIISIMFFTGNFIVSYKNNNIYIIQKIDIYYQSINFFTLNSKLFFFIFA